MTVQIFIGLCDHSTAQQNANPGEIRRQLGSTRLSRQCCFKHQDLTPSNFRNIEAQHNLVEIFPGDK